MFGLIYVILITVAMNSNLSKDLLGFTTDGYRSQSLKIAFECAFFAISIPILETLRWGGGSVCGFGDVVWVCMWVYVDSDPSFMLFGALAITKC